LAEVSGLFETQELGFLDLRFQLRGSTAPHPDIAIVEINDASIRRIGHWPWPRNYHATLLKALSACHPRLVLYDILFTEESLQPEGDQLLARAIHEAGNVIIPFFFRSEKPFLAFFPIPSVRAGARHLGYVNISADLDGKTRRIRKSIDPPDGRYHHTSVWAALANVPEGEGERWLDRIPVDQDNSFWINYPGDYSLFPRVAFHQIFEAGAKEQEELQRFFRDKVVLVGQTATGGGDFRPTPFSAAYPGVGIQAAAVHTLLTGNYLHRLGKFPTLGILVFLAFLVSLLTWGDPTRRGLAVVLCLSAFYLAWNFMVFAFLGWILPVLSPLVVILGIYIFILFFQFVGTRLKGELLNRELALAARIQESFLPREMPRVPGADLGFLCRFAKEVGGDLYDWVLLGERRLGICVGDVSGKGVPAALYMARATSEWRVLRNHFQTPSALMQALNEQLVAAGVDGIFVTFLYLIFDLDSKTVLFSNAGHEPFYLFRGRNGKSEWIRRAGAPPLGLFLETRYPEEKMVLEEGDAVILISDGVRELRNPKREEFGLPGVEKALNPFPQGSADEAVKQLFRAMDQFSKWSPAHDDRTVCCVKIQKGGAG